MNSSITVPYGSNMASFQDFRPSYHDSARHLGSKLVHRDDHGGPSNFDLNARMTMLSYMFRSNIPKVDEKKVKSAFIESGATRNVFHDKASFYNYRRSVPELVHTAHDDKMLIGMESVLFPPTTFQNFRPTSPRQTSSPTI